MSATTASAGRDTAPHHDRRLPSTLRVGLSRGWLDIREFFREWETVFFTFSLPTLFLVLFAAIFEGLVEADMSAAAYYLPGLVAMGLMSVSFQTLGIGVAVERSNGTLRWLRGTPMPPAAYFLGKTLLVLALAVGQVALLLGVAIVLYGVDLPTDATSWFTFTWVLVLGTSGCALLGLIVSGLVRSARAAQAVVVVPFLALQFFSGIFVPVAALPTWVVEVAALFPLKWMAQGMRSVFYPEPAAALEPAGAWELPLASGVLGVWCVAGLVLCLLTFRWRTAKDG